MLATLIGSRWRDYERQMRSETQHLALMLHQIFMYSATLSVMPAKLAMRLKLPAWTEFVRTADTIMAKVRSLVPKMIHLDGDGLLQMMMSNGIRDDDTVRIVVDFIIAAGDTVCFSIHQYIKCLCIMYLNLTKKKNVIKFLQFLSETEFFIKRI